MPNTVTLPSGTVIRYEYDPKNPISPARRFRNGTLTAEFIWANPLQLAAYKDHDTMLAYSFQYDNNGILHKVRIDSFTPENQKTAAITDWVAASADWLGSFTAQNRRERVHGFLGKGSLPLELFCGCDQVGTLKILTDKNGNLVKEVVRDSFGLQQHDSFPDLFMPIGFAGGLADPDTGLVRFGYRDYDPAVGRFTALDPARDRRGDGDLYDYCVDDPVNAIDDTGLFWQYLGKSVAKWIAKKIGKSFFNDTLNAPEEMVDVRNRIRETEEKIEDGTATEDEIKRLGQARQREDELWGAYGKYYVEHGRDFYRRYFPDDGYANKKFREQQNK